MDLESRDYFIAAFERIKQARDLYRQDSKDDRSTNHHPLSFYVCGVAVECMLRAFVTRKTREFDGRHDLRLLLIQCGVIEIGGTPHLSDLELIRSKKEFSGAIEKVSRLWNNGLRYASESRLRAHLHDLGLDRGIKGDPLKENLRQLLEASSRTIDRGLLLWEATTASPIR